MANVDIAPASYRRDEPCVLDSKSNGLRVVAILDGYGSWGTGAETAHWVRERLGEQWGRARPVDAATIAADLAAAARAIPEEFRDNEWGDGFAFAAALVRAESVQVMAQGRFGAIHFGPTQVVPLYTPGTWVMEQVAAG